MKYAADFRTLARKALKGNWGKAVIVTLVATLLGGIGSGGPKVEVNFRGSNVTADLNVAGLNIFSASSSGIDPAFGGILAAGTAYVLLAALVFAAVYLLLGSVVEVGYFRFNLELADGREGSFEQLFRYFPSWKNAVCTRLLKGLYICLWSLLLIIPGIIASYSYAMTGYILAERPQLSAKEALEASKQMMKGNRWRLFCLQLSFLGWQLLSALTLGVGNLWLNPYRMAAEAAFYREISGTVVIGEGVNVEF